MEEIIGYKGEVKEEEGQNVNQRYIEIFLETLEYVLAKAVTNSSRNKEVETFMTKKTKIIKNLTALSSHYEKRNLKAIITEVNKIIFSSKLNRIVYLLS